MRLRRVLVSTVLASVVSTLGACKEEEQPEGEIITRQTIGPEGGTISGNGLTLTIPAGALTADTDIELRTSQVPLGARDFEQSGPTVGIYPENLELRLPAELTFDKLPSEPAILFQQDGLTVASIGQVAYINELARVAAAKAGTPVTSMVDPVFGATPDGAAPLIRDTARLSMATSETPRLQLAFTVYDPAGAYTRPLNGNGAGDCGFELENLVGGSVSVGCTEKPITAEVRVSNDEVQFDLLPFLVGKIDTPVTVGVVAGSEELAYHLGFFQFETGPCFQETCSGHGVCMLTGDSGTCVCDEGYAPGPEPFTCECVPQCDGVQCGPDACGGSCPPGCSDGENCNEGVCEPASNGDTGSGDTGMGDTGMGDTGMGTTGSGDTGGTTSGGTTGGSTGGTTGM